MGALGITDAVGGSINFSGEMAEALEDTFDIIGFGVLVWGKIERLS